MKSRKRHAFLLDISRQRKEGDNGGKGQPKVCKDDHSRGPQGQEDAGGGGVKEPGLGSEVPLATCTGQVFNPTKPHFSCL